MSTLEQEKSAPFLFCHYVKSFFTVGCLIYIYVSDCFWELDLNPFLKVKVSLFRSLFVWYHLTHQICLLNYTLLSTFAPFCFKLAHIQLPIPSHTHSYTNTYIMDWYSLTKNETFFTTLLFHKLSETVTIRRYFCVRKYFPKRVKLIEQNKWEWHRFEWIKMKSQ